MTVRVIGRSEWGGGSLRSGHKVDHAQFKGLVAHHTVMLMKDWDGDGHLRGDLDDIKRYMRQLQHARPDLGDEVPYSWVVFHGEHDADCVVAEGRGFGVTGAHTVGYNSSRYGVAYAGNASVDPITPGILSGYRWVGQRLADPIGAARTFGHRDVKSTECPGNNLYSQLHLIQPPFTAPTEEKDMPLNDNDIVRIREEAVIKALADPNHRYLQDELQPLKDDLAALKVLVQQLVDQHD
jgi:hypothetical protein